MEISNPTNLMIPPLGGIMSMKPLMGGIMTVLKSMKPYFGDSNPDFPEKYDMGQLDRNNDILNQV